MNGTPHHDLAETPHEPGGLSPQEAARLLLDTRRRARRSFDFRSPQLTLLAAVVALLGFGAVWLSVRNQDPFTGPSAGSLVVLYALVAIRLVTVLVAQRRAGAGVSGRSARSRRAEIAGAAAALTAVYVLMAALGHDGGDHPTFAWVYGVTATLVALGAWWGGRSAAREDWEGMVLAVAIMLVAAGSALAGPRGMWLGDAVGCCVVLLASSAFTARSWKPSRAGR